MSYGLDWQIWKEQAMWVRNVTKESSRLSRWMGQDFSFHNTMFGSDCKMFVSMPYIGHNDMWLQVIDGYSLFDWSSCLENANHIHTVSTSIIYLLEMLDLTAKEVHLYPRKPIETDFKNIDYLLQKHKYILHA